jgi:arylsulfatase A-like enzyme
MSWFGQEVRTLADITGVYGYDSAAVWGATLPASFPTLSQGFRATPEWDRTQPHPDDYSAYPLRWLHDTQEPFFLLVHNIDLHAPLPAPPRYGLHRDAPPGLLCGFADLDEVWNEVLPELGESAARTHLIAHYRETLRSYDEQVGAILTGIEKSGLKDRTIIVVTGDHGEDLWDHGFLGHGKLHYDSVLRVPLLIVDPRRPEGRTVDRVVQTIDIAPTILELLGIPLDRSMDGVSLVPLLSASPPSVALAEEGATPRPVFSLTSLYAASLREERYKLMIQTMPGKDGKGASNPSGPNLYAPMDASATRFLYDLQTDPGEKTDISADNPTVTEEMQRRLLAMVTDRVAASAKRADLPVDDAAINLLRARGYWENVAPKDASR